MRAKTLKNYIRFGTDDDKEIWLLKYGFSYEDIDWLKDYIDHVDQSKITFKPSINNINNEQRQVIQRYLY